jgi:hypothetical protein
MFLLFIYFLIIMASSMKVSYAEIQWSSIQTVDSTENIGKNCFIALDSLGDPHINYSDTTNFDLKYAMWNGTTWTIDTIDLNIFVGKFSSIALDSNDYPHISCYDQTSGNLIYVSWNGSEWLVETVDSNGLLGFYSSIALDSNDNPHISYYDETNGDLKYTSVLDILPSPTPTPTPTPTSTSSPTPTLTPSPTSTPIPGNWSEVARFTGSGSGRYTTESFTCDHVEWRIRWDVILSHVHFPLSNYILQITTFPEGTNLDYIDFINGSFPSIYEPDNRAGGIQYIHNNAGKFYMKISASIFVHSYTIIIEQNTDSSTLSPISTPLITPTSSPSPTSTSSPEASTVAYFELPLGLIIGAGLGIGVGVLILILLLKHKS